MSDLSEDETFCQIFTVQSTSIHSAAWENNVTFPTFLEHANGFFPLFFWGCGEKKYGKGSAARNKIHWPVENHRKFKGFNEQSRCLPRM